MKAAHCSTLYGRFRAISERSAQTWPSVWPSVDDHTAERSHFLDVNNHAILPRSNCTSENADEVNTAARCFTGRFDSLTIAVQEHGT